MHSDKILDSNKPVLDNRRARSGVDADAREGVTESGCWCVCCHLAGVKLVLGRVVRSLSGKESKSEEN
jgi:hypothetical protein